MANYPEVNGVPEFSGFCDGDEAPPEAPAAAAPTPTGAGPSAPQENMALGLLEGSGGEHEEFAKLVCQVVHEELSGCDRGDKAKIMGTLAGVIYMAKVYAAQHATFNVGSAEGLVGDLLARHGIAQVDFDSFLAASEQALQSIPDNAA